MKFKPAPTTAVLLLPALLACAFLQRELQPAPSRPGDFSVNYEWREGSLPPPYHYEYTIRVPPSGEAEVIMVPDYPSPDVPEWHEPFTVDAAGLDALYRAMLDQDVFTTNWRALDGPPVGGSSASATITASGQAVTLPTYVIPEQQAAVAEVFSAIHALVAQDIWDRLEAKRQDYVDQHLP